MISNVSACAWLPFALSLAAVLHFPNWESKLLHNFIAQSFVKFFILDKSFVRRIIRKDLCDSLESFDSLLDCFTASLQCSDLCITERHLTHLTRVSTQKPISLYKVLFIFICNLMINRALFGWLDAESEATALQMDLTLTEKSTRVESLTKSQAIPLSPRILGSLESSMNDCLQKSANAFRHFSILYYNIAFLNSLWILLSFWRTKPNMNFKELSLHWCVTDDWERLRDWDSANQSSIAGDYRRPETWY